MGSEMCIRDSGGVVKVLRYAEGQLEVVAHNYNGSPSAGWVEDLNGDGVQEVVFDQTDPYVFCYACGVRRAAFEILRWDGAALQPVVLSPLGEDISAEIRTINDQAVQFANAGLWLDAGAAAYALRDADNETALWNATHIDLVSQYRALAADSAYPLMTRMFNGDYFGAVGPFVGLQPAQMFGFEGPLLQGTVADGWTDTMFPEIVETTTAALAVKPDEAGALFLRGWAKFFLNEPTALEDLARAAELAPQNSTFAGARDFLTP